MEFKVQKRNGSIEDYDSNKILRVVIAAGLTQNEAEKLVKLVNDWLKGKSEPQITSVQIRDRIIVEIQKINKNAANKFIWYEKSRDKNT